MRRGFGVLALGMVALLPTYAHAAGGMDVRVGGFFPRADTSGNNNLFKDDFDLYTVGKNDFRGLTGGIEFNFGLADNLELGLHADGYGRTIDTSYRNYVRSDDSEIFQTLKLESAPVGVTLRYVFGGRHASIAPYIGAGADLVFWHYEERGDFVDFQDPALPVIADEFIEDGVVPGFHVQAGVRVPINHDFAITGEARYLWAKEKDMGGSFRGLGLDLTGLSATVGVNIRF
jgi:outer membrane protein W